MEPLKASRMTEQFKRTFDPASINKLGKTTLLCRREREVTPYRLVLTLIEAFATETLETIADIHRTFNALCGKHIQYKPFHNQLSKPGFATFMRLMFMRLVSELACDVLQFSPDSPFARFDHIRIQDGTSLQLKRSLAGVFPGRFTNTNPAAVELHVDLNLMSEMINRVALSPDSAAERPFLPAPEQVSGGLIRGDRGYFSKDYLQAVDHAGGFFIIRAKADVNPLIQRAIGPDGREVKAFRNQSLKSVSKRLSRYDCLDMVVCFATAEQAFECRLVIHPNLRTDGSPRYLATNLDADVFSTQHISDGYRLRWQIELLFKEWKSHANLRTFDTGNPHIAEGLVWAALCAATVKRYCAHMTQCISRVAMSTRTVAKCIHHVLSRVLYDLMHRPQQLQTSVDQAIDYLSRNARRAHPKRDQKTGRLKLGLIHVFADA